MATVAPARADAAELGGAARHGVANLLGVAVAAVAGFGLNIVVTRGWSMSEAGLFFAATSAFMIAYAAARLGTGVGSVYFISRYRTLGQPERIRASVLVGLLPVVLVGTAIAVAGWWAAPRIVALTFTEPVPGAVRALRALLLFVPVAALCDFALAACRGFGKMRPLLLVERLGRTGLQLAGVGLAALLGLTATTALPLAWALPYLPAALLGTVWLARLVRRAERATEAPPVPLREEFGPYWRYSGPRALSGLAQMAVQRLDIVLLGALRGLADAALYTAATRFLALGQLSGQALSTAVQHRLATHLVRDDRAAAGRLYQAATGWLVLLAWPAYLLFAVFAGPMLHLFGDGYAAGQRITVFLSLVMLVATGCGMVDTVLNMAGRTSWTFYNALAGTVVNVVLNVLLIPRFGVMGAAAAWSASILLTNLVPLAQLHHAYRLHPFGRGTLTAAGLALACFGVPALLARTLLDAGPLTLAVLAAVGAAGYAGAVWRLRRVLQLDALRALRRSRGR
ncbi:lipopolysaccharide biosynthesis protein [Micromonospora olivasterospora]|uniref:lipopolysaccharide biosynthesis protein n=1 Tax=Micromonospora olivasterospora TaxID=1880 RepID=UPI001FE3E200|nr:polysaccharide biosynthesis C-terminal domain-containing protein [Micromonospora olivasterospora]